MVAFLPSSLCVFSAYHFLLAVGTRRGVPARVSLQQPSTIVTGLINVISSGLRLPITHTHLTVPTQPTARRFVRSFSTSLPEFSWLGDAPRSNSARDSCAAHSSWLQSRQKLCYLNPLPQRHLPWRRRP